MGSDSLDGVLGSPCGCSEEREGLEAKSGDEGRDHEGRDQCRAEGKRRVLLRESDTMTLMPHGSHGVPTPCPALNPTESQAPGSRLMHMADR